MALKLTNNATSKLAAAIDGSVTSLSLNPGDGSKFPVLAAGDWFPVVCVKSDGTLEIMKCTARATDTLTVVRAQESTAATPFSAGDRVELRMTAAALATFLTSGGGTLTGPINFNGTAQNAIPSVTFQLNATTQWAISDDSSGALSFDRYASGAYTDSPIKISSAGLVTVADGLTVNGTLSVSDTGQVVGTITSSGGSCYQKFSCSNGAKYVGVIGNNFSIVNQANTTVIASIDDAGNTTVHGNFTASSDERLKSEWETLPADFVERLAAVKSGTYARVDLEDSKRHAGVSAQSLRELLPEAVMESAKGMLSVAYGNAALVSCIELAKEVMRLRSLLEPTK